MKDLFVCAGGVDRSPCAANIARELARQNAYRGYFSDSWGMYSSDAEAVSCEALQQFDRIFVMDERMVFDLQARYGVSRNKIINLNVRDRTPGEENFKERLGKEFSKKLPPFFVKSA